MATHSNEEDVYDPYAHRVVEKPITNCDAFISVLKSSIGTGILAMPLAFHHAGWVIGSIFTFIVGLIEIGGIHLMIHCMVVMCKRRKVPQMSVRDAMAAALEDGPRWIHVFSNTSKFLVDFFLTLYQTGICIIYVVFVASSVKEVTDIYLMELNLRIHILSLALLFILILMIRHMKYLVPFSCMANCFIFIGLGVIFYYIFAGLPEFSTMEPTGELQNFSLFFGTVLFSIGAIGVMIAIEANMAKPKDYLGLNGVFFLGGIFVIITCGVFGFFGYWRYGSTAAGSITLNLPHDTIVGPIVNVMFAIAIYLSYPLQGYVAIDIIWNHYLKKKCAETHQLRWEYVTRIIIAIFTIVIALIFPNLGAFISLVGAFCISILGFIFPAIMHLCIRYSTNYGPLKYFFIQNILLIIFGIVGGAIGTYASVKDMVTTYT